MSDPTVPPLGYTPDPLRPHRVVIEFDVRARSAGEAEHMVQEVLIEELAGPPENLHMEGDRVFGEDFGADVASVTSWRPLSDAQRTIRERVVVPSPGWEPFEGTGVPEIVAEMFPPEPAVTDFRLPDGTPDAEGFEDAHEQWRDECLSLAVRAARLPDLMGRLERAERVRDALIDVLDRDALPEEPQKEDYRVMIAPAYEGEYEHMRYSWDHTQWRADFMAAARRREHTLTELVAEGGPRTTFLPAKFLREWVPADLIAIQALRALIERDESGPGAPLLDREHRHQLEAMLFAADPDVHITDPGDPEHAMLYAGPASEAHEWIPPGVYDAVGRDGTGEFRVVVGRVPLGDGVTASAAFPPAEHDSAVVNEIARVLEEDAELYPATTLLERVNAAVLSTGRTGAGPGALGRVVEPPTRLERGVTLGELLAEREAQLNADRDDPEPPTAGPAPRRRL